MDRPRWKTPEGQILVQVSPEEVLHDSGWARVTLMAEAYSYDLLDPESGAVVRRYRGGTEKGKGHSYNSDATLTRYLVHDGALYEHRFFYHEESTYDSPVLSPRKPKVVLKGLELLDGQRGG